MGWDVGTWVLGGLCLLSLALAAFAAAAEMALASVNRLHLRQLQAEQQPRAKTADALLSEPARLLSTLLTLKLLCAVTAAGAATLLTQQLFGSQWVVWALVGTLVLLLVFRVLPRAWTLGHEDRVALWLAPLVQFFAFIFTPITVLLRRIGHSAIPEGTADESIFLSEDGLRFLLNVSEEETTIEDEEKEMIASIFQLGDTMAREVMVPRIDVAAVAATMPMLDALDIILKAGHSRLPVYRDSIDNVIGVLYAKDLLRYLRDGRTDVSLTKLLRPAYFIPESKKVDDLLQELQHRRVHMAVVVDEYGGTAGIVTIEDLLEEIVGEIQDEYDAEEPTTEEVSEYEYLFDARVQLDEVNKLLEVELPSEGGDTLGGFIYSQLGKVPAVGDTVSYGPVSIEVLSVAGRRIKQVRATVQTGEGAREHEGRGERENGRMAEDDLAFAQD